MAAQVASAASRRSAAAVSHALDDVRTLDENVEKQSKDGFILSEQLNKEILPGSRFQRVEQSGTDSVVQSQALQTLQKVLRENDRYGVTVPEFEANLSDFETDVSDIELDSRRRIEGNKTKTLWQLATWIHAKGIYDLVWKKWFRGVAEDTTPEDSSTKPETMPDFLDKKKFGSTDLSIRDLAKILTENAIDWQGVFKSIAIDPEIQRQLERESDLMRLEEEFSGLSSVQSDSQRSDSQILLSMVGFSRESPSTTPPESSDDETIEFEARRPSVSSNISLPPSTSSELEFGPPSSISSVVSYSTANYVSIRNPMSEGFGASESSREGSPRSQGGMKTCENSPDTPSSRSSMISVIDIPLPPSNEPGSLDGASSLSASKNSVDKKTAPLSSSASASLFSNIKVEPVGDRVASSLTDKGESLSTKTEDYRPKNRESEPSSPTDSDSHYYHILKEQEPTWQWDEKRGWLPFTEKGLLGENIKPV